MKYIVKIPPVAFYFWVQLLENVVSIHAVHSEVLWIKLHLTVCFMAVETQLHRHMVWTHRDGSWNSQPSLWPLPS